MFTAHAACDSKKHKNIEERLTLLCACSMLRLSVEIAPSEVGNEGSRQNVSAGLTPSLTISEEHVVCTSAQALKYDIFRKYWLSVLASGTQKGMQLPRRAGEGGHLSGMEMRDPARPDLA